MPTKKKARTHSKKEFGVMTVKLVMQKLVQSAHLKTKGDVIASLMIEGFGAVPVVDAKISSWASSANMICWLHWMTGTSLVPSPPVIS